MIVLFLWGYNTIKLGDLKLHRVPQQVWEELLIACERVAVEFSVFQGGFGYRI